jgi:hypothetical protein
MSIAQLQYIDTITLQNISVESSNVNANGTYSNVNQSNDIIAGVGVPNAVWTTGVGASNDQDLGNGLVFSCQLNDPVSPQIPALILLGTSGSQVGNGSVVEVAGDLFVGGNIVNGNSNGGKSGGEIEAYDSFFNDFVDNSYYIQDATNNVITIWLNVSGKVANTQSASGTGIIAIPNNPNDNVYYPPVNSDYVNGDGAVNFINFMMNIQTQSGATTGVLGFLSQGSNTAIIYCGPSYTWTEGDALTIQATIQYPY